jgi:hypothetical protein
MTTKTYLSGRLPQGRAKSGAAWRLFGALIDAPFDALIGPLIQVFAQELIGACSASYELPYTLPALPLRLAPSPKPSSLGDSATPVNFLLRTTQLAFPQTPTHLFLLFHLFDQIPRQLQPSSETRPAFADTHLKLGIPKTRRIRNLHPSARRFYILWITGTSFCSCSLRNRNSFTLHSHLGPSCPKQALEIWPVNRATKSRKKRHQGQGRFSTERRFTQYGTN